MLANAVLENQVGTVQEALAGGADVNSLVHRNVYSSSTKGLFSWNYGEHTRFVSPAFGSVQSLPASL